MTLPQVCSQVQAEEPRTTSKKRRVWASVLRHALFFAAEREKGKGKGTGKGKGKGKGKEREREKEKERERENERERERKRVRGAWCGVDGLSIV